MKKYNNKIIKIYLHKIYKNKYKLIYKNLKNIHVIKKLNTVSVF